VKIALVILHADPARGGAERYTLDLAAALRGRGHDVSLLASSVASLDESCVHLESSGLTRAGNYEHFLDSLDQHLDQVQYEVVHAMLPVRRCDVYHPHAGIAAEAIESGHLKHEGTVRRAFSRIGNRLNRRRQNFAAVEQALLTSSNPPAVLCLSEYVKGTVRKHYDLAQTKLETLFNAVDLTRFNPATRPEAREQIRRQFSLGADQTVGLMIAQDFARKGLKEAIEALALASDPRLVLLVVGKQDATPYRKLAADRGVPDRVIFNGPTKDPYVFYRAADFFVLPTRHDPCSLVVLESLAMGLPVISTVFNGACEIMRDGTHGFVLSDASDINALAQAMTQMSDANRRREMGQACLQLRPALSYDNHVDRLLEIYHEIAAARRPDASSIC
jgi:UDP-glucose:(heptosyl)LPS alpha-1,3-glucosyltransferase